MSVIVIDMIIAVGTQNKAKLSACEAVFSEAFAGEKLKFLSFEVESGVSAMPMSNNEIAKGAVNRAIALKNLAEADYYVGLEGGVQDGPQNGLYLLGWAAILVAKSDAPSLGHSGGVKLPDIIAKQLKQGAELGPLIQKMIGDVDNEIRHSLGTNGLLTKGLYKRDREFEDAIRCALGPLIES